MDKGQQFEITIDSLSSSGEGVGRTDGLVVFVTGAAPGDRLRVRAIEVKKRFCRASLVKIIDPSPDRVEPPCPYFGRCGGCDFQHIAYPRQLAAKQQIIIDAFQRIGKIENPPVADTIAAGDEYGYRRRARLAYNAGGFGFSARGSNNIIKIKNCQALIPNLNRTLEALNRWAFENGAAVGAISGGRLSAELTDEGERPASINFRPSAPKAERDSLNRILVAADIKAEIDPADRKFIQINDEVNRLLIKKAVDQLAPTAEDTVLDLYSGDGNFTFALAKTSKRVIAIEKNRASITAGKAESERMGVTNIEWRTDHAEAAVAKRIESGERIDLVLLDPPREGAAGVARRLAELGPRRIAYISCDPATAARDIKTLIEAGYALNRVTPFDMFPQTAHTELLAILERGQ